MITKKMNYKVKCVTGSGTEITIARFHTPGDAHAFAQYRANERPGIGIATWIVTDNAGSNLSTYRVAK